MIKGEIFPVLLVVTLFALITCSDNSGTNPPPEYPFLKKVAEFTMAVREPSGLALSIDGTFLWTVSDQKNKIYKIDFEGEIIGEMAYRGNDLEGIIQSTKDSTIWVAEEFLSQMVQLDTLGNKLDSVVVSGAGGSNGLEGICINTSNNHFFLLKEQNPGVLIELSENFDLLQYKQISFAFDFSGITYDSNNQLFWILSDQSQEVYEYSLNGEVLNKYPIDVRKAEGIAIDAPNNLIYIVSDSHEKLYVYSIHKKE